MDRESLKSLGKYSHLGVTIGVSVAGMTYLGSYLDKKFDTSPFLLIVGLIWGFGGSMYYLVRVLNKKNG